MFGLGGRGKKLGSTLEVEPWHNLGRMGKGIIVIKDGVVVLGKKIYFIIQLSYTPDVT